MKTNITQEQINAVTVMAIRISILALPFGAYQIGQLLGVW